MRALQNRHWKKTGPIQFHALMMSWLLIAVAGLIAPTKSAEAARPTAGLTITPSQTFGCFKVDQPLTFTLRWTSQSPSKTAVTAVVTDYYNERPVLARRTLAPDKQGQARVTFQSLDRGAYKIRIIPSDENAGALNQSAKALAEQSFVVMSDAPPAPANLDAEWLGLCTHLDRDYANPEKLRNLWQVLQLIGARWVRINDQWDWLNPKKGEFSKEQVAFHQKLGQMFTKAGMGYFAVILATPGWAADAAENQSSRWRFPPKNWKDWTDFIQMLAAPENGMGRYFEIWNEPGGFMAIDGLESKYPGGKRQVIAQFNRLAHQAAHKANPKAVVLGPSSNGNDLGLIQYMLDHASGAVDVLTHHYPKFPLQPRGGAQQIKRMIDAAGNPSRPVWFSETRSTAGAKSLQDAAEAVRYYLLSWAEDIGTRSFIYVLHNARAKVGSAEDVMALISSDGQPRPGVVTLQTIYQRTRDAHFIGMLELPKPLHGMVYEQHGQLCAAIWSEGGKKADLPRDLTTAQTQAFDMFDNPVRLKGYTLGTGVTYLEGVDRQASAVQAATVQLRPWRYRVDVRNEAKLQLTLANLDDKPQTISVEVDQATVTSTPQSIQRKLDPGQIVQVPVGLQARHDGERAIGELPLWARVNGQKRAIGHLQYFDRSQVKTLTVADFNPNLETWEDNGQWVGSFAHAYFNYQPYYKKERDYRKFRRIEDPDHPGQSLGEFWADWYQRKKPTWVAAYFDRGIAKTIPGVPISCTMSIRAPQSMLVGSISILLRMRDRTGQHFQFEVVPHVTPGDEFKDYTTTITSPIEWGYIHSRWGGADDGVIHYPLAFEGFSLNVGPQVYKNGRFRGGIQVRSIKVNYYQPSYPLDSLPDP